MPQTYNKKSFFVNKKRMRLAIVASESAKNEILQKPILPSCEIRWLEHPKQIAAEETDIYMDFDFTPDNSRITLLKNLLPRPVFINSVTSTLSEINYPFIRINGWPGFIKAALAELAVMDAASATKAAEAMQAMGWEYKLVPDKPGLVTPRVISMIINEAFFALGEKVSTRSEMDIAMKLGTNYPYGPFEWASRIGVNRIKELLRKLSKESDRYIPAEALLAESE